MTLDWIQYPHGTIKWLLESSQGLLLRWPELQGLLLVGCILTILVRLERLHKFRWLATLTLVGYSGWVTHYGWWEWGLLSVWITSHFFSKTDYPIAIPKWLRLVVWPILPSQVEDSIPHVLTKRVLVLARPFLICTMLLTWQWLDLILHYDQIRSDMEQWPTSRLDPAITELAHSEPNVRADWHGVRIIGQTAVITCERKPRLSAISLKTGYTEDLPLHPRWGIENVGPLASEVDHEHQLVWTVNGGTRLLESKWNGRWTRFREVKLPSPLSFSYITRSTDTLFITEVQTGASDGSRKVLQVPLPSLSPIREVELQMNGEKAPMPREALWIPTIQQHIYASEFGEALYAANLDTGEVVEWLAAPTFNGKMIWHEQTERIYLAVPNRMQIHVINPTIPAIEYTLWTQPGVRALAVDAKRNLLISASVLTGQIWIQDLTSGHIVERLGTVYPMVREMAVSEALGIGVLSTWNAVYKFDYGQL